MEGSKVYHLKINYYIISYLQKWLFRGQIRIEILNGSIRISTNENGTWMNTSKPFELKSPEIRWEQVTHMYVGVGKAVPKGNMKVKAYQSV